MKKVTEFDLRAEEFKHQDINPSDLEFREDGKIVRKNRFEQAFRSLVEPAGFSLRSFEIEEVVERISTLLDRNLIIQAIVEGRDVVFRSLVVPEGEVMHRGWRVWKAAIHQDAAITPFNPLYEFELLNTAKINNYWIASGL